MPAVPRATTAARLALAGALLGPVFLIFTGTTGIGMAALGWHRFKRRAWSDPFAVAALVLIYLTTGALNGFTANPPAVAYVSFAQAPDSRPPGWFVRLGDTAQSVLLAPCADQGRVIEVPTSRVALVEWPPPKTIDSGVNIRRLGAPNLYANCP